MLDNGLYLTDLLIKPSSYSPFNDKNAPASKAGAAKKSSPLAMFKSYLKAKEEVKKGETAAPKKEEKKEPAKKPAAAKPDDKKTKEAKSDAAAI